MDSDFAMCSFVKSDIDYIFKDPYNTTIIKGECFSEKEFKKGKLSIGKSDKKVKKRKQAIAIALREANIRRKNGK